MSLSIGLVGLPNVGKSTLFEALTKKQVPRENYPFCTIDPHVGTVAVPDERLSTLSTISSSEKTISTTISFTDIAGLVEGAHSGEGLGNQFLTHIREVDAIAHIVRLFTDTNVSHVHGTLDPANDIEIIELELIMADVETVEKRCASLTKKMKGNSSKEDKLLLNLLERALDWLKDQKLLNTLTITEEEKKLLNYTNLITIKPMIYVYNNDELSGTMALPESLPSPSVILSAPFELELSHMKNDDARQFLSEAGLDTSGINELIKKCYSLLNLITFYTSGVQESRAWTLQKGSSARDGAEQIHSDIADGLVKADIITYDNFIEAGGWSGARTSGTLNIEGKNYIMKDGDLAYFHFTK